MIIVRAGGIVLRLGSKRRRLGPGDATLIEPHRPHSLHADGIHEMIGICVGRDFLATTDARDRLAAFLETMIGRKQIRRSEKKTILAHMDAVSPASGEKGDALDRLRSGLESNPERETSLADMSAVSHIGERHLLRKFKSRYGLTPRGFLNQNRIRKARRELMADGSLTRAALMAEFYDQSHFIRHFKRLHGMTPRQYLRSRETLGGGESAYTGRGPKL
jgi:AraC-like DNA-binding protein